LRRNILISANDVCAALLVDEPRDGSPTLTADASSPAVVRWLEVLQRVPRICGEYRKPLADARRRGRASPWAYWDRSKPSRASARPAGL